MCSGATSCGTPSCSGDGLDAGVLAVRHRRYDVGLLAYPLATALGLLSVPLFLALMLALAGLYLLPTPELG